MVAHINKTRCIDCNICRNLVKCPQGNVQRTIEYGKCIGCGVCKLACPQGAIFLEELNPSEFKVYVNNIELISSGTVKTAIESAGMTISKMPDKTCNQFFVPCDCGGCWTCLAKINGRIRSACVMALHEGMKIETNLKNNNIPVLRVVSSFGVHSVGGVGTPYALKGNNGPIEVVGFTHGCNLRCPQYQNFQVALTAGGNLIEPLEACQILLGLKNNYELDRITISGGESTLNRRWLVEVIKSIRKEDNNVNIHVDTNGTIINLDYIDELVLSGMTDIRIDLKALRTETYMEITGLEDRTVAENYLQNSWNAVKYIARKYVDSIFLGIGIPYNKALLSYDEIRKMGEIFKIKSDIQVCVLDYRPEFRRKDIIKPSVDEMMEIKKLLNNTGLKTVIVQTDKGHFGP